MQRTPSASPHTDRGFAMVFAMFVTMLLLVVGLAMLAVAQYSASNTANQETKQGAFNAAEAGLNSGIDALDTTTAFASTNTPGSLANGYTFTYTVANNLSNPTNPLPFTDPVTGQSVSVPPSRALVIGVGQGPNGERPTTVMAVVKQQQLTVQFPNDAIDAGLDIQGNWNFKIGVAGSSNGANDANVHANHNITATIGFLQGVATASGTIDSLNAGPMGINTPQKILPTTQMAAYVAAEKSIAQAGGLYALYLPSGSALPTTYTCPSGAPATGCVVFYDGPLSMSGAQSITFYGKTSFIVNGNYSETGNAQLTFESGTHSLFAVNGDANIAGNGQLGALTWVKGNTTLGGNGAYVGALVTGGSAIFNGGGASGGFTYDLSLQDFTLPIPGHIVISAYGEY